MTNPSIKGRLRTCVFGLHRGLRSIVRVGPSIHHRSDGQHDREYSGDSFEQAVRLFEYLSYPKIFLKFLKKFHPRDQSLVTRLADDIFNTYTGRLADTTNFCTYVVAKWMSFLDIERLEVDIDLGWVLDKEKILIYGWWKFSELNWDQLSCAGLILVGLN